MPLHLKDLEELENIQQIYKVRWRVPLSQQRQRLQI